MQRRISAKRKVAREYSSESLMLRSMAGIVMIALGVVGLLSTLAGLRGAAFDLVRDAMHGLGGIGCLGIPVFLIWGGVLSCFSARRSMPVRSLFLLLLLYLCLLAITNLLSKVGESAFMDHVVRHNKNIPLAEPESFGTMLGASYQLCAKYRTFGGALGMLLGWVTWTFLGTTGGMVVLVLICLACALFFSRFDVMGWGREWKARSDKKLEQREQERQRQAYELQMQQRMAQAPGQSLNGPHAPAYKRREKKGGVLEEACVPVASGHGNLQAFPGPMGQLLPMPMGTPFPGAQLQNPPQMTTPIQPNTPPQLYDEYVVTTTDEKPFWRRGHKAKSPSKPTMENGQNRAEGLFAEDLPQDRSTRKVVARMGEIVSRKAEIAQELGGMDSLQRKGTILETAPETEMQDSLFGSPIYQDREEPAGDRDAAFKRPAGTEARSALTDRTATAGIPKKKAPPADPQPYAYPTLDLLNMTQHVKPDTRTQDAENAACLEQTLESFAIPAKVQRVTHGPAVTRFELGLVSSGINVKRILSIADNIALEMAANGGVRIEIPIPGTNLFGIEVPNTEITGVTLAEVLVSPEMSAAKSPLTVALGRDIAGKPILCDLARMPHLLIAGQTGSGKSVCINTIINSILFRSSPEHVRMIMIDPKVVELQSYNVVPHLLIPVVCEPHKAAGALAWAVAEMLDRYHKMQSKNVREISAYNAKLEPGEENLPRIVIIIDELADLMLACKKEVEESIIRLAQLARAAGIHMVVATQRPTVDVITGLIKANIPSRISFAVSSSIDSRTILDMNGAEKLLGRGDMFYLPTGASAPTRVQGCFLSDGEIERVVNYIGTHAHVEFDPNIIEALDTPENPMSGLDDISDAGGVDDKLQEAIEMAIMDGQASISMLQRRMKIGYARAGRLIDDMTTRGVISRAAGSKPREVLMSREEYERMKESILL